jgi:hypothetical protein
VAVAAPAALVESLKVAAAVVDRLEIVSDEMIELLDAGTV